MVDPHKVPRSCSTCRYYRTRRSKPDGTPYGIEAGTCQRHPPIVNPLDPYGEGVFPVISLAPLGWCGEYALGTDEQLKKLAGYSRWQC